MLIQALVPTTLNLAINPTAGASASRRIELRSELDGLREVSPPDEVKQPDPPVNTQSATQPSEPQQAESETSIKWWSKASFSFKDILDMINPLQHLPIISTLYRAWSGEGIGAVARVVGGAIYGRAGGIGSLVSSLVNAVIGAFTGKDVGERVYAALFGGSGAAETQAVASKPADNQSQARALLAVAPVAAETSASFLVGLTYHRITEEDLPPDPAPEHFVPARAGNGAHAVPEVSAREFISPRRMMTREALAALDLYDRMIPARRGWRKDDELGW
jgi:hypothetical protein